MDAPTMTHDLQEPPQARSMQRLVRAPFYSDEWVTLYHGDCAEILPTLSGMDFVFTSPPYVDQRTYQGGFPAQKSAWLAWLGNILTDCLALSPSAVFNIGDRRREGVREWDAADFWAHVSARGVKLWERFLWLKDPFGPNGSATQPDDPMESCLWFGAPKFNSDAVRRKYSDATITRYRTPPSQRFEADGQKIDKSPLGANANGARPATVIIAPALPTPEATGHPAQFPLELPTWFIQAATMPGDVVLDCFAGSGTTLRAAKDLNRRAIGIEINERYCEIAARRMAQGVLAL